MTCVGMASVLAYMSHARTHNVRFTHIRTTNPFKEDV